MTRAVAVLQELLERRSLSLEDAAALTSVSKSTAFRLLTTLQNAGLVERLPGGGYRTGPELVRWGLLMLGQLDVPSAAAGDLRELWLETRETVGLGLVSGMLVVLAEILESPAPFRMAEVAGTVVPMHSSALGHAVGAYLPTDELTRHLGNEPYSVITPTSPLHFAALQRRLDQVVQDGYALDNEMSALGVACVAAPVFMRGAVAGAISVAGPRLRMTDERLAELGPRVAQVALRISGRLSLPEAHQPDSA
ncbi:MAG: IclR family transcriptional regulator [Nakamurella sp.]